MLSAAAESLFFYVFSAFSVLLALAVVSTERILRAAVYLMGVLSVSAGFYLLLGAEFLAGIQILVYVGGIVVLFIFAVMLTRPMELREDRPGWLRKTIGITASSGCFGAMLALLRATEFSTKPRDTAAIGDEIGELGLKLLDYGPSGYVLPFELISLVLLAAVIGSIVLARKTQKIEKRRGA
jgi:NADH-quinone oxidoreductase subunit J